MIQSNSSCAKFKQVYYGIKWAHNILGFRDPLKSPLLIALSNAAKRMLSKPVCKKEPIKPWHPQKLVKLLGGKNASLLDLRLLTMCLVGFAGFFRFSELINIRRNDIIFYGKYLKIFKERSKTDKYRKGTWIFIAKTCRKTCPVSILRNTWRVWNSLLPPMITFLKLLLQEKEEWVYSKKHKNAALILPARKIVLEASEKIRLPRNKFGLPSLRSGGATSAANIGVKDRLFKKHGRWKSEKAKDGYIKHNIRELLHVSANLGISVGLPSISLILPIARPLVTCILQPSTKPCLKNLFVFFFAPVLSFKTDLGLVIVHKFVVRVWMVPHE